MDEINKNKIRKAIWFEYNNRNRAGYPHSLFVPRKKKRDTKELKQLLLSLTQKILSRFC